MNPGLLVVVNGRLVAEGTAAGIRDLMTDRPRTVVLAWRRAPALAADIPAPPRLADVPVLRPSASAPAAISSSRSR